MQNRYNSFSEIDERLKILNLQRQVYKESIKLNLNRAKTDLYPTELLSNEKGMFQKMAFTFAIKKMVDVLRVFRKRDRVKVLE